MPRPDISPCSKLSLINTGALPIYEIIIYRCWHKRASCWHKRASYEDYFRSIISTYFGLRAYGSLALRSNPLLDGVTSGSLVLGL